MSRGGTRWSSRGIDTRRSAGARCAGELDAVAKALDSVQTAAKQSFVKSLQLDAKNTKCYDALAELMKAQGKNAEADLYSAQYKKLNADEIRILMIQEALKADPSNEKSVIELCDLLEKSKRFGDAADACLAGLKAAPQNQTMQARLEKNRKLAIEALTKRSQEKLLHPYRL